MERHHLAIGCATCAHTEPHREAGGKRRLESKRNASWLVHHFEHDVIYSRTFQHVCQLKKGVRDLAEWLRFGWIDNSRALGNGHHVREGTRNGDVSACRCQVASAECGLDCDSIDFLHTIAEPCIGQHQS